jgi:antitoxin ParD1/3/4
MNLSLSPDLQKFVDEKVRSGQYDSPEAVVRTALALLKSQDDLTPDDVDELRRMLAPAIDRADRGEVEPWDVEEIRAEVERRSNEKQQKAG